MVARQHGIMYMKVCLPTDLLFRRRAALNAPFLEDQGLTLQTAMHRAVSKNPWGASSLQCIIMCGSVSSVR